MLQGHWCCMVASISSTVQNGLSTQSRLPTLKSFSKVFFLRSSQGGGGQGRRRQWCHPRQKFANIYGKGKKLQAGASGRERNRAILEKHVSSTYMCHGIPRNSSLDCKLPTLGVPACPPQSHVIIFYGFCLPFLPPGPSVTGTASPPHHRFKALIMLVAPCLVVALFMFFC
jgi:hypothetical protein